jgi:hypothetical protein
MDNTDATREATPATIIVAWVNFCPVPPKTPIAIVARSSDDALEKRTEEESRSSSEGRIVYQKAGNPKLGIVSESQFSKSTNR